MVSATLVRSCCSSPFSHYSDLAGYLTWGHCYKVLTTFLDQNPSILDVADHTAWFTCRNMELRIIAIKPGRVDLLLSPDCDISEAVISKCEVPGCRHIPELGCKSRILQVPGPVPVWAHRGHFTQKECNVLMLTRQTPSNSRQLHTKDVGLDTITGEQFRDQAGLEQNKAPDFISPTHMFGGVGYEYEAPTPPSGSSSLSRYSFHGAVNDDGSESSSYQYGEDDDHDLGGTLRVK